jgi:hypothetical protein
VFVSIICEAEKEGRRQSSALDRLIRSVVTRRRRPRETRCPPTVLAELRQKGMSAMITLFGTIIFATVIAIGALDRNSGLRILQKYESPWHAGPRRNSSKPTRQRRGRSKRSGTRGDDMRSSSG